MRCTFEGESIPGRWLSDSGSKRGSLAKRGPADIHEAASTQITPWLHFPTRQEELSAPPRVQGSRRKRHWCQWVKVEQRPLAVRYSVIGQYWMHTAPVGSRHPKQRVSQRTPQPRSNGSVRGSGRVVPLLWPPLVSSRAGCAPHALRCRDTTPHIPQGKQPNHATRLTEGEKNGELSPCPSLQPRTHPRRSDDMSCKSSSDKRQSHTESTHVKLEVTPARRSARLAAPLSSWAVALGAKVTITSSKILTTL